MIVCPLHSPSQSKPTVEQIGICWGTLPNRCLQSNNKICKCSHITLHVFFKENYVFDRAYSLKQMIKLVASKIMY